MQNIFIEFLPPWIETGLQPAFYDKESGTILQQVSRMYAKMNELISAINKQNSTIEEYINKFIELKDYVDDYFENLDVQEEINNKLDDMAESGELEEIIATYINASSILAFDDVADMKSATNLIVGSYAETYGFYSKGDAGGAKYKIRAITNVDTVDEMTLIALDDNTLVAELMSQVRMNVRQFGAKGDGSTDDTAKIQKAFDFCPTIEIPSGTYMIDAVTSLLPNSNNQIYLDEDAILKAIPNNQTHYAVIKLDDVDNVIIKGGIVEGERNDHLAETGEWGFCISIINGSSNIKLNNITLKDGWGDGLYINDATNVYSSNLKILNNRRNGISVVSVNGYISDGDFIKDTNGTNPQFGVDIEPNYATEKIIGVVFNNTHLVDNINGGIKVDLKTLDNTSSDADVTINDMLCENSTGIKVIKSDDVNGVITFNNPKIIKAPRAGIDLTGCKYNSLFPVFINYPYITCGYGGYTSASYDSAIITSGDAENAEGGVTVTDSYINNISNSTSVKDYYINGSSHFQIINPIKGSTNKTISSGQGDNFLLIDPNRIYIDSSDYNSNLGGADVVSYITNGSTSVTARTKTISQYASTGYEFTVSNLSDTYNLGITLTNCYCKALSSTQGVTITLAPHALMKLRKITATDFELINQVGTLTVS